MNLLIQMEKIPITTLKAKIQTAAMRETKKHKVMIATLNKPKMKVAVLMFTLLPA